MNNGDNGEMTSLSGGIYPKKLLFSSLIRATFVFAAGNALTVAIPFLALPFLTRHLSPSEYGIISMFEVVVAILIPLIGLATNGAITRYYFEGDNFDFPVLFSNCFFIVISCFLLIFVAFSIGVKWIEQWTGVPGEWLLFAPVFVFCRIITMMVLALWQAQMKAIAFGLFSFFLMGFAVGLGLFMAISAGYGWKGWILGQFLAYLFFAIVGIWFMLRNKLIRFKVDRLYFYRVLKYGGPLVPYLLGMWGVDMVDRVFLNRMVGLREVGLYSVGGQIGKVVYLIQTSFNQAWTPWAFSEMKRSEPDVRIRLTRVTYIHNFGIILVALIVGGLAPWILRVFVGEGFREVSQYVFWLGLSWAIFGMYTMAAIYIFFAEMTMRLALVVIATGGLNCILNYILIGSNGAIGAAYARCISYCVCFLITWIISRSIVKSLNLTRAKKEEM